MLYLQEAVKKQFKASSGKSNKAESSPQANPLSSASRLRRQRAERIRRKQNLDLGFWNLDWVLGIRGKNSWK
jgi:hypothetical protein